MPNYPRTERINPENNLLVDAGYKPLESKSDIDKQLTRDTMLRLDRTVPLPSMRLLLTPEDTLCLGSY